MTASADRYREVADDADAQTRLFVFLGRHP
jgi:hypothetical protein